MQPGTGRERDRDRLERDQDRFGEGTGGGTRVAKRPAALDDIRLPLGAAFAEAGSSVTLRLALAMRRTPRAIPSRTLTR